MATGKGSTSISGQGGTRLACIDSTATSGTLVYVPITSHNSGVSQLCFYVLRDEAIIPARLLSPKLHRDAPVHAQQVLPCVSKGAELTRQATVLRENRIPNAVSPHSRHHTGQQQEYHQQRNVLDDDDGDDDDDQSSSIRTPFAELTLRPSWDSGLGHHSSALVHDPEQSHSVGARSGGSDTGSDSETPPASPRQEGLCTPGQVELAPDFSFASASSRGSRRVTAEIFPTPAPRPPPYPPLQPQAQVQQGYLHHGCATPPLHPSEQSYGKGGADTAHGAGQSPNTQSASLTPTRAATPGCARMLLLRHAGRVGGSPTSYYTTAPETGGLATQRAPSDLTRIHDGGSMPTMMQPVQPQTCVQQMVQPCQQQQQGVGLCPPPAAWEEQAPAQPKVSRVLMKHPT